MQSYRHADPRPVNVSSPGLGFDLSVDLLSFDLRPRYQLPTHQHAKVLPCTMSIDFGADSSSRFPFRAGTNRQTNRRD